MAEEGADVGRDFLVALVPRTPGQITRFAVLDAFRRLPEGVAFPPLWAWPVCWAAPQDPAMPYHAILLRLRKQDRARSELGQVQSLMVLILGLRSGAADTWSGHHGYETAYPPKLPTSDDAQY
jgi:hypothetical protein